MRSVWRGLGAFTLGLGTAGAWVVYIQAVASHHAATAAIADLFLLLAGSAGVQLWSKQKSFRLFLAYDCGAALGTYFLVRWQLL